jgi:phage terminase small subunit
VTRPLTPKQQRFVDEYLIDLNGKQAAIRAGYSAKTAHVQAARLLSKANVAAFVAERMAERSERTEIKQDEVLQELLTLLRSDVRDFVVDEKTGVLDLREGAPETAWRAVSSVKHRTIVKGEGKKREVTHEAEVRLWDKPAALKMAGQHLGLYTEKVEHSGKVEGTGVLAVPVPVGAEQWGKMAERQQEELTKRPPKADLRPEG